MTLHKRAASKIELEEGWEPELYVCPTGYQSIGFGFNLEASKMPKEVGDLWLSLIVKDIESHLSQLWFYRSLNDARKIILIDMYYQMGFDGLMKFKRMWVAIKNKNFGLAADEMLDSLYAVQTPNRAKRNANIMRTGEL